MKAINSYYDQKSIDDAVARNEHRALVGGMWEEIGHLQLGFLRSRGMRPNNTLLDLGCGSLRLGVNAVEYLDAGNYWGTDINAALLRAGYDREIAPAGLSTKLPRSQLIENGDFDFSALPRRFDFVMAQSLFTHLPPTDYLRRCLANLSAHLQTPCTLFATFFIVPADKSDNPFKHEVGGIVSNRSSDPYHYTVADIQAAASQTAWSVNVIGEWAHPRDQQMVAFRLRR